MVQKTRSQLSVVLEIETLQWLKKIKAKTGVPITTTVKQALTEWRDNHELSQRDGPSFSKPEQ
jgi:hypothetical protein